MQWNSLICNSLCLSGPVSQKGEGSGEVSMTFHLIGNIILIAENGGIRFLLATHVTRVSV